MTAEVEISKVVKLLGKKMNLCHGVENEVQLLRDKLIRMQSFLADAKEKQAEDDRVRIWISKIRDVALEAKDAIEMLLLDVKKKKSRVLLRSIISKLDTIDKSRESYGIRDLRDSGESTLIEREESDSVERAASVVGGWGEWPWAERSRPAWGEIDPVEEVESREPPEGLEDEVRRPMTRRMKDEHLVGMEDDVKKLLEPIMDEEQKGLLVAAVVGMAGIGKSALAREVYNHPDVVSGRFDCRAWVVFTPQETIKQLILNTTSSEQEKQDLREQIKKLVESTAHRVSLEMKLKELLHKRLEQKTYFIVLDNLFESDNWDSIMTAFPNEQDETSRLLLTTRETFITKHCHILHEMKILGPQKSWELFLKKCLSVDGIKEFLELVKIGRRIVEKCDGLPLAINIMGGLLAETQISWEWQKALNELDFHMVRAESSISAILELSYQNLSPHVRSCFLCFAFFEEGASIPVKRLVNIVFGLGLTHDMGRTMTEEISICYLNELINRNMVQIKDLTLDNRVKSCYLHDFLHDLCLANAKEELGLEILRGNRGISLQKPLHLVVLGSDLGSLSMNQNKHILSLFILNVREEEITKIDPIYWKSFQNLSILDLDCDFPLRELPDSFRFLRGLKQLTIHRQTKKIFFTDLFNPSPTPLKLPIWLSTFKKLELLDLGTELVEFPLLLRGINSLRHLHAYCVKWSMISWKNVETLKYIRHEDWMSRRRLDRCEVRELGIIMVDESSKVSALSLEKLEKLVKLYLVWNYFLPIDATIDIPHLVNVTKLKLNGMMRECRSITMLPPNLTHLTLENSFLDEDPMQELSKLRRLLYLKLKDHSYMGDTMQVLRHGFRRLIALHLRGLFELRHVNIEEGGMPQLKLLQVRDCFALSTKNLLNKSYQLQILNTI